MHGSQGPQGEDGLGRFPRLEFLYEPGDCEVGDVAGGHEIAEWVVCIPQGDPGNQGLPGENGYDGNEGVVGPQGIQGERGDIGATGVVGEIGAEGIRGIEGPTGIKGDPGQPGGPIGVQGEQGTVGLTGPNGATGATGNRGPRGLRGERGERGASGLDGGLKRYEVVAQYDGSDSVTKNIRAECSDNLRVTGGGYSATANSVNVIASNPLNGRDGWQTRAINNAGGRDKRWDLWVWAICSAVD